MRRPAGVHDDRAGDDGDPAADGLDLAHHRRDARDADLDAPLRRDLVRHEREAVAIAFLELRHHAHAGDAADDVIAGADVAQLAAQRAPLLDDDDRVHPLALDLDPLPAVADERPVVRRRVEVVGHAAVAIGALEQSHPAARRAGSRARRAPRALPPSSCSVGAEIRIEMNDGSSLLRPMSNFRTSNDALRLTTVSKTTFRICESIRWPSASTTSLRTAMRPGRRVHAS